MTDLRIDRLGLLVDQLDRARELAQARLEGVASPASSSQRDAARLQAGERATQR